MTLVRLLPASGDCLWDGTKLKENCNKKTDLDIVAKSWELSIHKDGQSIVDSGEYEGLTLSECVEKLGKDALGTKGNTFEFFPILVKLIDAEGNLSIQVHPDNEYALRVEKEYGKIEVWYILGAEEGASLCYGTSKGITKDESRTRIKDDTILDVLKKVPVHKGDVFFIELRTIHAIGEGIAICEAQQNSNTTYRAYDFGHVDEDEKSRKLHIEKAIDTSNLIPLGSDFKPIGEEKDCDTYKCAMMVTYEHFIAYVYDMKTECSVKVNEESFVSFVIADGEGSIGSDNAMLSIHKRDSIFASANADKVIIEGSCRFILSKV